VPTVAQRRNGTIYPLFLFSGLVKLANEAQEEACSWLRQAFVGQV
jgi:hypothetical protein